MQTRNQWGFLSALGKLMFYIAIFSSLDLKKTFLSVKFKQQWNILKDALAQNPSKGFLNPGKDTIPGPDR